MSRALSLTEEQVSQILSLLAEKMPVRKVAAQFGVSHPTILMVKNGTYGKFGNNAGDVYHNSTTNLTRVLVTPDPKDKRLPPPHRPKALVPRPDVLKDRPEGWTIADMRLALTHLLEPGDIAWNPFRRTHYFITAMQCKTPMKNIAATLHLGKNANTGKYWMEETYNDRTLGEPALWAQAVTDVLNGYLPKNKLIERTYERANQQERLALLEDRLIERKRVCALSSNASGVKHDSDSPLEQARAAARWITKPFYLAGKKDPKMEALAADLPRLEAEYAAASVPQTPPEPSAELLALREILKQPAGLPESTTLTVNPAETYLALIPQGTALTLSTPEGRGLIQRLADSLPPFPTDELPLPSLVVPVSEEDTYHIDESPSPTGLLLSGDTPEGLAENKRMDERARKMGRDPQNPNTPLDNP